MSDVFATVIVPAADRAAAHNIAGGFDVPLSATGAAPATHFIASGYFPPYMAQALGELADVEISVDFPATVLDRLGLQMVMEPE